MLVSLKADGREAGVRRVEDGSVGLVDVTEGGSGRTELRRATYFLDGDGRGPVGGPLARGATTVRLHGADALAPVVAHGYWLAFMGSPPRGDRMVIAHLNRSGAEVAREELDLPELSEEDEDDPLGRRGRRRRLRGRLSRQRVRVLGLLVAVGALVSAAVAVGGDSAASRHDEPGPPPGLEGGMTVYGPAGSDLPDAPRGVAAEQARDVAQRLLDQAQEREP
ncbi:MAG: hypothetical protein M3296_04620 [Actinomycetota bacterium]|nr:hypothetical protein [Actinomycetota bacterium]